MSDVDMLRVGGWIVLIPVHNDTVGFLKPYIGAFIQSDLFLHNFYTHTHSDGGVHRAR